MILPSNHRLFAFIATAAFLYCHALGNYYFFQSLTSEIQSLSGIVENHIVFIVEFAVFSREVKRNKTCASVENTAADIVQCTGKQYSCKRGASAEYLHTQILQVITEIKTYKRCAVLECMLTDCSQLQGKRNFGKRCAGFKRVVVYLCYAARNRDFRGGRAVESVFTECDIFKRPAIIERKFLDCHDTIRNRNAYQSRACKSHSAYICKIFLERYCLQCCASIKSVFFDSCNIIGNDNAFK